MMLALTSISANGWRERERKVIITFAHPLVGSRRICYTMCRWTSRATCESAYTNRAQIRKDDGHGGLGKPGCASRVRGNIQDKLSGRMSQRMSGPLRSGNRLIESLRKEQ